MSIVRICIPCPIRLKIEQQAGLLPYDPRLFLFTCEDLNGSLLRTFSDLISV